MVTDDDRDNYCDYIREHMPVLLDSVVSCCDPSCSKHCSDLDSACTQLLDCWLPVPTGVFQNLASSAVLFLGGTYRLALLGTKQTFGIKYGVLWPSHFLYSISD